MMIVIADRGSDGGVRISGAVDGEEAALPLLPHRLRCASSWGGEPLRRCLPRGLSSSSSSSLPPRIARRSSSRRRAPRPPDPPPAQPTRSSSRWRRLLEVSLGEVAAVEASLGRASGTAPAAAAGDASSARLPVGVVAREEKEARRGIEREGKEARRQRRHHDDEAATAGAIASRRERRRGAERRRGVVLEERRSLARERKG
uniref:Uncharacterized protein n=1 Tax=Oryza barthii TaxID=65489 RepID=A0A0D3F4R5_9ORYZ